MGEDEAHGSNIQGVETRRRKNLQSASYKLRRPRTCTRQQQDYASNETTPNGASSHLMALAATADTTQACICTDN